MNPSTTKTVSYSELDSYRQCRLKHHLSYKERWRPTETAPALSRGKLFHAVMERHYLRVQELQQLNSGESDLDSVKFDILNKSGLLHDPQSGNQTEEQELVQWIYEGYVDNYGLEPEWEVLLVEQKLESWLPTENGNRSTFKLKGTIDLLVRDRTTGGVWVVDHKTCRNLPKDRDIDLDDQMALYVYLLNKQGFKIRGAIYNACRSHKLKREMGMEERFSRTLSVRTEKELETVAAEVLETFREAYRPIRSSMPPARQQLPIGGSTKPESVKLPPRSPDPDRCGWRCPFTESCIMGRKGSDIRSLLSETGFEQNFERH